MLELGARRLLEGRDAHALRVEPAHHVLDRPVLARGVHRLEDDEQRAAALRVQALLQRVEPLEVLRSDLLGGVLVEPCLVVRLAVGQLEVPGRTRKRSSRSMYVGIMPTPEEMLQVAIEEARAGLDEGGIPIGAALFGADGTLSRAAATTGACRTATHRSTARPTRSANAGRQRGYRDTTMVTTLAPCWYCSGLSASSVSAAVVVGESRTFQGGHRLAARARRRGDRPRLSGVRRAARRLHRRHPEVWNEDIGV